MYCVSNLVYKTEMEGKFQGVMRPLSEVRAVLILKMLTMEN